MRKNYSSKNINVFEFNEKPKKSRKVKIKLIEGRERVYSADDKNMLIFPQK